MLKSRLVALDGKDQGLVLRLTERPALIADNAARAALRAISVEPDGGAPALALLHTPTVRAIGPAGNDLLMPFIDARVITDSPQIPPRRFDIKRDLKDWHNVAKLQQAALLLHVGFLIGRKPLDVPVAFTAAQILQGSADIAVTFCSPHIAAVLESGKATYREVETVLSLEDIYNIVEILNVAALRDWAAHNAAKP